MASLLGPRSWKGTHIPSLSLCGRNSRGYTVSTEDMLTSTAPVLPALSEYSLHPRHTRPTNPGTQFPTTQSWFAFHTAVPAHVPSLLGSSRSVFVHAGDDPCAPRAHLPVMAIPCTHCPRHDAGTCATRSIMLGYQLICGAEVSVCEHIGAS